MPQLSRFLRLRDRIQTSILLVLLFSLMGFCPVLAQGDYRKGYYITLEHDSIPALIAYSVGKSTYKMCVFRTPGTGKKEKYYPHQILAYGFVNGKRFTSMKLPKSQEEKQVFMEQLVAGDMDLYQYNGYYVQTNKDSLVFLPPEKAKEVHTKRGIMARTEKPYIGILNYLLFDCTLSANKIDYVERELIALIQNYNRCKGAVGITYKERLPKTKITSQYFTGVDISQLKFDNLSKNAFGKSASPVFGASLEISAPRFFDRASFSVELQYTKKSFQGFVESQPELDVTARTDYYIDISFLKIPVGLRYNFLKESQTPYIKVGFVQYVEMNSSLSVLTETESYGIVTTDYEVTDLDSKNQNGFWVGIGFSKIVYRKVRAFVEFRYETANGFVGEDLINSTSSTNCLNILVGVRL